MDFFFFSLFLQTIYLPVVGLVDPKTLKPGDLVGVNKDSYLVLDTLPAEYDSRVKAMEVDERPTEQYSDIGGLEKQIQELIEAIVLPMKHKEAFENLGIKPPKGIVVFFFFCYFSHFLNLLFIRQEF
jgi:26S proteasome regulatory subunit T5